MLVQTIWRILPSTFSISRHLSVPCTSSIDTLLGKDFIQPCNINEKEWKDLLWTAMDLKHSMKESGKRNLQILSDKHITIMFIKPSVRFHVSYSLACQLLGAKYTEHVDPEMDNNDFYFENGKVLTNLTDLVVISGAKQPMLLKLAEGCSVPVISCCSTMYCITKALADVMTLQEHYGRLQGLTLAWVGPSTTLCNTYLCLVPLLGINIRFVCMCSGGSGSMSPIKMEVALNVGKSSSAEMHQCTTAKEAVYHSDVIVTSMHSDEKQQINHRLLEEANKDWTFLHSLPRSEVEVSDDIFMSNSNLSWRSSGNLLYVAMAMMLKTLKSYHPSIQEPNFSGSYLCR